MKNLCAGSRRLLVIVALVVIASTSAVSTARAASSATGGGAASIAASHSPAATALPSGQCTFVPAMKCQSTDPIVALNIYYYGGSADCTFVWDVDWGDGHSTSNLEVDGPANGYRLLAQHTYLAPETYTIAVTGLVIDGNCVANAFTATFTLLAAPSAPPIPSCPAVNNTLWNGYAVCGSEFSGISARWTVPAAHGGGNKKAAFWVGLGGLGTDTTLEQDGTESNIVHGKAVYTAWWEFVPSNPAFLSPKKYPVHAGDVIDAVVIRTAGDHYFFILDDYGPRGGHHEWHFISEATQKGATRSSAEVIAEDTGQGPLTHFGSVTFSRVSVDGHAMAAYGAHLFEAPGGKVSVSSIGKTAKFTVTFKHS
jgi:hypothetical protein